MESSQPAPFKSSHLVVSAPGKVILHGEHSVVYGKLAVAASLDLRTTASLTESGGDCVRITLGSLGLAHSYQLEAIHDFLHTSNKSHELLLKHVDDFLGEAPNNALKPLFYLLAAICSPPLRPFDLHVTTELEIGAGSGSSASYNVCLAAIFLQWTKGELDLNLVCKWAFEAEKIVHGTPSGVDNTVCTFGGVVEFRRGAEVKLVELKGRYKVLLINTKVPRKTKDLVAKAGDLIRNFPSITEPVLESLDNIAQTALTHLKNDVIADYDTLELLAKLNHDLLRFLGVSHAKLEEVVGCLGELGLHGKLTGAGGGGYAICWVPPHKIDVAMVASQRLHLRGFDVRLVDLGGAGVRVDSK